MGKPSPASRRAALAAQREAEVRAARRTRLISVALGGILALALVIGLGVWWNQKNKPAPTSTVTTTGAQLAAPSATKDGSGMVLAKTPTGKPTLVIYEDYQCPWCKVAADSLGTAERALAAKGEIGIEVHSITLLDQMLKNDSSQRANVAATCADVVGKYVAYHDHAFASQPEKEGTGYTDAQLRGDFATAAGIYGGDMTSFQACYDQRQTEDATQKVLDAAKAAGRDGSSPTYFVRSAAGTEKELDIQAWLKGQQPSEADLLAAIKAAA